jgi:hypothetical protein
VRPDPNDRASGAKSTVTKRYLASWKQGYAALTTDWHNQCQQGKPISLTNNGLIKGRKKCAKCSRFRCKHQVFGDIRVQEKWALGKEVSKRVSHGVEWQD